jgi:hypothetical protein
MSKVYDKYLDIWMDTAPAKKIAELEQQLLEANAKSIRLTHVLKNFEVLSDCWLPHNVEEEHIEEARALHTLRNMMLDVLNESPTESLALHNADVIEKMVKVLKVLEYYRAAEALEFNVIQLRNSVKEGE